MDKNYYLQIYLEECKYTVKEKKLKRYVFKDLDAYSEESNEE